MKLKAEEEKLIRQYVAAVDKVVHKWVPSTVPGGANYKMMVDYANLRAKIIIHLLSPIQKKLKYRQIDIEEAIRNEKQKK